MHILLENLATRIAILKTHLFSNLCHVLPQNVILFLISSGIALPYFFLSHENFFNFEKPFHVDLNRKKEFYWFPSSILQRITYDLFFSKGSFYSESAISKTNIPNHYPELKIWISCLLLLSGNIFRKFRFKVQDSDLEYLFWRFDKHIVLSEKDSHLQAVEKCWKSLNSYLFIPIGTWKVDTSTKGWQ